MKPLSLGYLTLPAAGPVELIASAHAAGLSHVGLRVGGRRPDEPGDWLSNNRYLMSRTRQALDTTGVQVLSVSAHYVSDLTTVADYGPVLDAAAALRAPYVCISNYDPEDSRAADTIANLAAAADVRTLRLAFEFVPYSATPTLDRALAIIRQAGKSNITVLLDLLHFMRSGSSIETLRSLPSNRLGYVQLCDGPLLPPDPTRLAEEARGARFLPGTGSFPFHEILSVLPRGAMFEIETPQGQSKLSDEEQVMSAAHATRAVLGANGFRQGRVGGATQGMSE